MAYEKTNFVPGSELTSGIMNKMEEGIAKNDAAVTAAAELANANKEALEANAAADAETAAKVEANRKALDANAEADALLKEEVIAALTAIAKLDAELDVLKASVAVNESLVNEVAVLSNVLNAKRNNILSTDISAEASTSIESDKDVVINSSTTVTTPVVIKAKNVEVQGLTVESVTSKITAGGIVNLTGIKSSGVIDKETQGNAAFSVNTTGDTVRISNCKFGQTGYNALEIGLSAETANVKNIVIENCEFADASNNSILIFRTAANAVVTIKKCTFGNVSNAIRISNAANQSVTVNVIDCNIASVDKNLDYTGIVLCEDYTSKTVEEAEANNLFAPEKVKFNFVNVTVGGKKVVAGTPEEQFGSKTAEQLLYVYRDAGKSLVGYDATKFPSVSFA